MNKFSRAEIITILAMLTTVDMWSASVGQSDPYRLEVFDRIISIMSIARGISIVVVTVLAITTLKKLGWGERDRQLGWILKIGVFGMFFIEAFVISPYTITAMAKTEIAQTLLSISPILYGAWAIAASAMQLLAVGLAAVSSLAEKPERQPRKERNVQLHPANKRKPRKNSK